MFKPGDRHYSGRMGHDHKVFARVYSLIAHLEDGGSVGRARRRVCAPLRGRVVIVGLGPGLDLHHLPAAVTEVIAVEPSASMRRLAHPQVRRARAAGLAVTLLDECAERLPLADNSVDGVLFSFVLCTVQQPDLAIAEARRVLRADGSLAVLEHVGAARGSRLARLQRWIAPLWHRFGGGCHCDRDTRSRLTEGGFATRELIDLRIPGLPLPVSQVIEGEARVPTGWRSAHPAAD